MSSRLTLLLALSALAGPLLALPTAQAGYFPGDPIDGPSADIVSLGDVDIARDGTGAMAYVKRDGGVEHVFVSRLVAGAWQAPERVDGSLPGAASQPVVAASDGGRLVVAFVNGGVIHSVLRVSAGAPYGPAQAVAPGTDPSVDMSFNATAYLAWTGGTDVRAARLDRKSAAFEVLASPVDVDPGRNAGDGLKRPRVVVNAEGSAVVAFGEDGADGRTHVYARRLFGLNVSAAPQDLTLATLDGRSGLGADTVDIDTEDDSSYAWVVFRQAFDDGGTTRHRAIARRLRGSQFEDPVIVDALTFPSTESATTPRIDLTGRGEGIAVTAGSASQQVFGSALAQDAFVAPFRIDSSSGSTAPAPVPAIAENGKGSVTWILNGSVALRPFNHEKTDGPEVSLSRPELGPVDPQGGLDAGINRAGDSAHVFVQGVGAERRIVAAAFDRPPGPFVGNNTQKFRNYVTQPLSWQPSFELQGPLSYAVEIDGAVIGTTGETKLAVPPTVTDGEHRWRVVATDRRGQRNASPSRVLRVDRTPPRLNLSVTGVRREGLPIKFVTAGFDGAGSGPGATTIDFGDGTPPVKLRSAEHVYRPGLYVAKVTLLDKAGNQTVVERELAIKKKPKPKKKKKKRGS